MADVGEALSRVPLFARLPAKQRGRLAERMAVRTWGPGEAVTVEGKSGIGFWIIEAGSATVEVGGETVRSLGPGDHFGEVALLDEGPRTATIVAETELRCRGMTAWEFKPFVEAHPEAAWVLLQTLAARIRAADQRRAGA